MNDWYDEINRLLNEATDCVDCVEEQLALEQQCMEYLDNVNESELEEGAVIKKVMRKGKAIRRKFCKMATQKLLGGKCVAQSASSRNKKKRGARKGWKKKRGKMGKMLRSRRKSLRRGKGMSLYKKRKK